MAIPKFKMPERKLLVKWIDASSVMQSNGVWKAWKKLHKDAEPATIFSMGYVVKDEPKYLTLTSQLCEEDGTNDGNVTILKSNIIDAWWQVDGGKYGSQDTERDTAGGQGAPSASAGTGPGSDRSA